MSSQPASLWQSEGLLILKVMLLSGVIATGIKTLGPQLAVPETTTIALTVVLLPSLIMSLILGFRAIREF